MISTWAFYCEFGPVSIYPLRCNKVHKDSRASVVPKIVPVDHVEEAAKINVAGL